MPRFIHGSRCFPKKTTGSRNLSGTPGGVKDPRLTSLNLVARGTGSVKLRFELCETGRFNQALELLGEDSSSPHRWVGE
jgi:hypothetical protein